MNHHLINGEKSRKRKRRCVVFEPCHISQKYYVEEFQREFKQQFFKKSPFPHYQLKNFVDNSGNIVEAIEEELQSFQEWKRKENDMYSLYQTNDLNSYCASEYPNIYVFKQFLKLEVKPWLEKVTGISLIDQIDCNGSCYSHTDSLLPHNDLIETRRFAFVYYLTSGNWNSKKFGGNLQLFDSDNQMNPTNVAIELKPARNSLIIFEVSEKSWHRVEELLSDEPRLSINGWFHSNRRIEPKRPEVEKIPRFLAAKKFKLTKLVNNKYLNEERQNEVQKTFAEKSELNLTSFLMNKIHNEIYEELNLKTNKFKVFGPVSKRNVARISVENAEKLEKTALLVNALKSETFRSFIEKLSGVSINGSESSISICRIEHGSYWMIGDEDSDQSIKDGYCLDVHIFIQEEQWNEDAGGDLIYVADGEEEELLRVSPNPNSMSLIFREPGVISFLKMANSKSRKPFYLFSLSYYNTQVVEDSD